jgi:hypothetical protein
MEKQNVTLSLPKALLKKAKLLAVREETSFNELVRCCLEQHVGAATGYEKARERQLKMLDAGFDLGTDGIISVAREEVHHWQKLQKEIASMKTEISDFERRLERLEKQAIDA